MSCSTSTARSALRCAAEAGQEAPGIEQPLSDLAVEIINEALEDDKQHVFASPLGDQPLNRRAMADALRGKKRKGKVTSPGICALLDLKPFTPHDLRRTGVDSVATELRRIIGEPAGRNIERVGLRFAA